ncbi:MAG TPA: tripartite tricarboxylate transporter substrate binding protein [Burkholderiales bacterium]|nr:tripartite tricarboxylate transporter substrate binding protein [Burkholderiales bacterium]
MATRRRILQWSGAALAAAVLPRLASAQNWPTKPIRAIVPFTPGSTTDVVGRIVLNELSAALGQNIVVENRSGAGGSIGTAVAAKAEPDGYTILINASAYSVAPAVYPNLPYDASRDFSGVAVFGVVPNVTLISPSKGIKTLKELLESAKKRPMTFASAGVGSATHWAAERLLLSAGVKATHVPYKGGPEALTDVMTGRVDFMCTGIGSGLSFIRSGKLIPLAVSTVKRSSALPDVPTTIEAGYPNSDFSFWNGLLVPAKTPRNIVTRLHGETQKVLRSPAVVEKFKPLAMEPMPLTPAEFAALIKKEIQNNIALAKAVGLKFN